MTTIMLFRDRYWHLVEVHGFYASDNATDEWVEEHWAIHAPHIDCGWLVEGVQE